MQCIFNDKTEIILTLQIKIVYYLDKKGEKYVYLSSKALQSAHTEMTKRLKYVKDILKHLLEEKGKEKENSQLEKINKKDDLFENNLKQLKSYQSSDNLNGENIIIIEFVSTDQTVNYRSVMCKRTDTFSKIENIIYDEYKELKRNDYYFLANGNVINKSKTLEENKIRDKDVIAMIECERKSYFLE